MKKYILPCLLILSSPTYASDSITPNEINSWLTPEDIKSFELFAPDERQHIFLTNKESAYLVPASMNDAGRNSMFRIAVAIPNAKKVILLDEDIVKDVNRVMDLDDDGTSEIVVKSSASGQGSESGTRSIIQINQDGSIEQLHSFTFENSNGFDGSSYSHDVEWNFVDLNNDNIKDLEEKIITKESIGYSKPTVSSEKHAYIYKSSRFSEGQ